MKKTSLWQLFATFFKTGLFTFGGGYAMIAILQDELVEKKKWITNQDMLDLIVVAESTPGVIAVNAATSIGYKTRGVLGSIIATLGIVLPSFLIISVLSYLVAAFQSNVWYQSACRKYLYSAPSTSQVLKWLRDIHGIFIIVFLSDDTDKPVTYEIYRDTECIYHHHEKYFSLQDWDKANLDAIEYTLDKFI